MDAEGARGRLSLEDLDSATRSLASGLLSRCAFGESPDGPHRIELGVSGGADSLAMLALAVLAGHDVLAIHVDHGLRTGSRAEADVVEAVCVRLGAQFEAREVRVGDGPNLEARARDARYRALGPRTLVAHTADDRAEWVLIALMRGTGVDGLAAMDVARRPILGLRRTETVELCERLGFEPLVDPHNLDPRFRRVRVRAELIPLMNSIADRDVVPLLDRLAAISAEESDLLDQLSESIDPTDAKALSKAPRGLARRAVRRWLRGERPLDLASTDRVLDVAAGRSVATEIVGGRRVRRSSQRLIVEDD